MSVAEPEAPGGIAVDVDVEVVMRDGTRLLADVYRPSAPGRYPVLLGRTSYGRKTWGGWIEPVQTAAEGYVVVINDTRGGFGSEGRFAPYFDDAADGYDTVEWCGTQEWSNGKVGMFGSSTPGFVQLLAAAERPPHLVAIAPMQTWSNFGHGCLYDAGGGFSIYARHWALLSAVLDPLNRLAPEEPGFDERVETALAAFHDISSWSQRRPMTDFPLSRDVAGYLYEWMEHPDEDEYWAPVDLRPRYGDIEVPALHLVGWFDRLSRGTIENFVGITDHGGSELARNSQWLIAGPWVHGLPVDYAVGGTFYGRESWLDVRRIVLDWYDYWLKGEQNYIPDLPKVHQYVLGAGSWATATSWPHPSVDDHVLHLHSAGAAATAGGWLAAAEPGAEAVDRYVHDPETPVPGPGPRSQRPPGRTDQTSVEARTDVLVYTSEALTTDVWVSGQPTVELWAATSAVDADWVARLVDVQPDGTPLSVCEGMIRSRYRNSMSAPELVTPNEVTRYLVELLPTSIVFAAGHRVRLEICSSSFPEIDPNPGTGGLFSTAIDTVTSAQSVYHDSAHPSRLVLPVVPAEQREGEPDRLVRRTT